VAVIGSGTGLVSQRGHPESEDEKTVDQSNSALLRGPTGTIKAFKSSNQLSSSPSTLDPVKTAVDMSSLPPALSVPILPTHTLSSSHATSSPPQSPVAISPSTSHPVSMWGYEVEVRPRRERPKSFVGKLFA